MTGLWNPEFWNGLGIVSLVVFAGAAFFICVTKGWLIPGRHHREIIEGKNSAIKDLRDRAAIDAETMKIQAQTIAERDAVEDATTRLLRIIRNEATAGDAR